MGKGKYVQKSRLMIIGGAAMSYYDDFDDRPRRKRIGVGRAGLIGGIIGGLLVLMLVPLLTSMDNWGDEAPRTELPKQDYSPNQHNDFTRVATTRSVSTDVSDVVALVQNSIVGVVNLQRELDLWTRKDTVVQAGTGSGVIFDRNDHTVYVVTNYHVVQDAAEVEVVLASGERVGAEIKGVDPLTDLAVLAIRKFDGDTKPLPLGNSERLKAGEPAIAIGNPLGLDFSRTVTVGVISSTQRSIPQDIDNDGTVEWEMDVIQTDAAINPGNSGGALININGELVGINSAKISEVGIEGMGFAIPISDAKPLMYELLERGTIRRPYIGLTPKDLQEVDSYHWDHSLILPEDVHAGVVVIDVALRGPAATAGLRELDVIVRMDDVEIRSSADLRAHLYKNKHVGDSVAVTYYRDGRVENTSVVLGEMDVPR